MEEVTREVLKESIMETRDELPLALTPKDLQGLLPFGQSKIYELLRQREIPCKKVNGKIIIPREKFLVWFYTTESTGGFTVEV